MVAGLEVVEDGRFGDADLRHGRRIARRRRSPPRGRARPAKQPEHVAAAEDDLPGRRRQVRDHAVRPGLGALNARPRQDVGGPIDVDHQHAGRGVAHAHGAPPPTGVLEPQAVAGCRGRHAIDGNGDVDADDGRRRRADRHEPEHRGPHHRAEAIPHRLHLEDGRARLDLAGPDLRSAKVHLHGAWPADLQAGPLQVLDHLHPRRVVVVGAIDAHAVHAALQELADEGVVAGRLTGHRDHDPDRPARGRRTEQRGGVPGQQLGTFGVVGNTTEPADALGLLAQGVERTEHRFDGAAGMRFEAAERRQPVLGEHRLERPQIGPAQRQVVHQIACAAALRRRDQRDRPSRVGVVPAYVGVDALQLLDGDVELGDRPTGRWASHASSRPC